MNERKRCLDQEQQVIRRALNRLCQRILGKTFRDSLFGSGFAKR